MCLRILTPKYNVKSQTVVLYKVHDFVDFHKRLPLPTLFVRRVRHGGPTVRTAIRDLSFFPEYGTRICCIWTHSENRITPF